MKHALIVKVALISTFILLVVATSVAGFILMFGNSLPSLIILHYQGIMRNLDNEEMLTTLRGMFEKDRNFTDITDFYKWEHDHVQFINTNESFERSNDPLRILQVQKGKCGEFSVLYVALCLAYGQKARITLAFDVNGPMSWTQQHNFVEVKIGNNWTHVDPSDQVWNETFHYATWSWGKTLGSTTRIYAFEDGGTVTDITQNYE